MGAEYAMGAGALPEEEDRACYVVLIDRSTRDPLLIRSESPSSGADVGSLRCSAGQSRGEQATRSAGGPSKTIPAFVVGPAPGPRSMIQSA